VKDLRIDKNPTCVVPAHCLNHPLPALPASGDNVRWAVHASSR